MYFSKYEGFTLIEAIVTVTIISILSTISFVLFSQVTLTARDGVRRENLALIHASFQQYKMENAWLPVIDPDEAISLVVTGSEVIAHQGYLSNALINVTKMRKWWHDPKDLDINKNPLPYTFMMNHARTKISLWALLEDGGLTPESRFPYVYGSRLPIFFSGGSSLSPDSVLQWSYNTLNSLSWSLDISTSEWSGSTREGVSIAISQSNIRSVSSGSGAYLSPLTDEMKNEFLLEARAQK